MRPVIRRIERRKLLATRPRILDQRAAGEALAKIDLRGNAVLVIAHALEALARHRLGADGADHHSRLYPTSTLSEKGRSNQSPLILVDLGTGSSMGYGRCGISAGFSLFSLM